MKKKYFVWIMASCLFLQSNAIVMAADIETSNINLEMDVPDNELIVQENIVEGTEDIAPSDINSDDAENSFAEELSFDDVEIFTDDVAVQEESIFADGASVSTSTVVDVSGKYGTLINSGDCSATPDDHVQWARYANDNGDVLIFTGSGKIKNYRYNEIPWKRSDRRIRKLVIEEGITGIESAYNTVQYEVLEIQYSGTEEQWSSLDGTSEIECIVFCCDSDLHKVHASDICGENAIWELCGNFDDGYCLTIRGSGKIEYKYFHNETYEPWIWNYNDYMNNIIIEEGISEICSFEGWGMETIELPKSVTKIPQSAFYLCERLKSIDLSSSGVVEIGNGAFGECVNLERVILPDGLIEIGEEVFSGCSSLESIVLPDGISKISAGLFSGLSQLVSITLTDSITGIDAQAFYGCSSLESIVIPKGVKYIDQEAFYRCTSLKEIKFEGDAPIFYGINNFYRVDATVLYPSHNGTWTDSKKQNYGGNITWKEYGEQHKVVIDKAVAATCDSPGKTEGSHCSECGKILVAQQTIAATGHTIVTDVAVEATCKEEGKTEGSHCSACGKIFSEQKTIPVTSHSPVVDKAVEATCEESGKTEGSHCNVCGSVIMEQKEIPALGHNYVATVTKATTESNGIIETECTKCGDILSPTTIEYLKTVELSQTSYTYNGKERKPFVTVMDGNEEVINGTNYTVRYSKGRKNVGQYNVKITFKGNYSGTVTKTYKILPKSTSITKKAASQKGFTLTWKKLTSQTTGYQIQYSTNKKFTSGTAKTKLISKNTTTSYKISKLKANKTYYARIRTYKTIKVNGKSTKLYSPWSKTVSVKTKK